MSQSAPAAVVMGDVYEMSNSFSVYFLCKLCTMITD